jgi:hypothetical protein
VAAAAVSQPAQGAAEPSEQPTAPAAAPVAQRARRRAPFGALEDGGGDGGGGSASPVSTAAASRRPSMASTARAAPRPPPSAEQLAHRWSRGGAAAVAELAHREGVEATAHPQLHAASAGGSTVPPPPRYTEGGARGVAAVVSFLAAVMTEIYLCGVCSCPEILRQNGRGQVGAGGHNLPRIRCPGFSMGWHRQPGCHCRW